MLIHCTFSPPLQSIFIPNLIPTNKQQYCPNSFHFSIFQVNETALCYVSTKPTKSTFRVPKLSLKAKQTIKKKLVYKNVSGKETRSFPSLNLTKVEVLLCSSLSWLASVQVAQASECVRTNAVYEVGQVFELGIQLSYLLILLALLGVGSFFVIRQVLVRRELDLSAKELQEQVRSGDASATELFELGAVMLRRKVYSAATKYLIRAINKWDGNDQDLAQVYNALGVSYILDAKVDKGIAAFENAVKLQPGYVTAWTNLGDAYEKNDDLKSALKAFEEVLVFDPDNRVALPRRDALKEKVAMYRGVSVKSMKK
ncbi:hypothetical protein ACJIZ3_003009 [Penstemon smallii]|uniref:Uncharacterized protein n=1 Tax=Penstemon smallii TaxID=265156 RepID=A0ABD3U9J8_9LAMI